MHESSGFALQIRRARNLRGRGWRAESGDFIACDMLDVQAMFVNFPPSHEAAY